MSDACATCAASYSSPQSPASEKPLIPGRYLACCGRSICARCLNQNKRYETYCPHCQVTSTPSALPQGLKDPPPYSSAIEHTKPTSPSGNDELPPYSAHAASSRSSRPEKAEEPAEDVLHFLKPDDSMHALSLAYGVPIEALRRTNNVFSDHLLHARKTVLIPGEFYKDGVSLSPEPVEGEEEEARKNKVRRWMVACKVSE